MAVDLNKIPGLSSFQRQNIGTFVGGHSGILPYQKYGIPPALLPNVTPRVVLPSHGQFYIFS